MRATRLMGVLVLASAAAAQDSGLVDFVERQVDRYERPRDSVPRFTAPDMYDREVSLREYEGRNVVLTFFSAKSQREAVEWLRSIQTDFLGDPAVVFLNILDPGPTPAFSSKKATGRKIREIVEKEYKTTQEAMRPEDRRRFEQSEIRWIIDWRRELSSRYDVPADRVHILLLDRQGLLRERISRRTPATEQRLVQVLDDLRRPEPAQ